AGHVSGDARPPLLPREIPTWRSARADEPGRRTAGGSGSRRLADAELLPRRARRRSGGPLSADLRGIVVSAGLGLRGRKPAAAVSARTSADPGGRRVGECAARSLGFAQRPARRPDDASRVADRSGPRHANRQRNRGTGAPGSEANLDAV